MPNEIGLIGLGRMGRNLAANMAEHDIAVRGWDPSTGALAQACAANPNLLSCDTVAELVRALTPPRCVMLMVPDGYAVDQCLTELSGDLDKGDVVIDAGNSHYRDMERRQEDLLGQGVDLLGLGVSGGPAGALHGPALMAGGSAAAWQRARPVLESIAAQIDGDLCAAYLGEGGAGHFVKMVHNGIEYAILQILADVFDLLSRGCDLPAGEIAEIFTGLNSGPSAGFLIEASEHIVAARDETGEGFLIDAVDDRAAQNKTGRWAVEVAMEFGVAVPSIAAAVQFRALSADEPRREAQDGGASRPMRSSLASDTVISFIGPGVGCAMASAFAQGFALIDAAEERFGEPLDRRRIASIWRSGCILRGEMVNRIAESLATEPQCPGLLGANGVRPLVAEGIEPLRELAVAAVSIGLPAPGLSTAAGYVNAIGRSPLSTRFIQLHRDYFGGHGFRRTGKDGLVHGPWHEDDNS